MPLPAASQGITKAIKAQIEEKEAEKTNGKKKKKSHNEPEQKEDNKQKKHKKQVWTKEPFSLTISDLLFHSGFSGGSQKCCL